MYYIITAPYLMHGMIVNDESTITSNLTMDIRMDAVEIIMVVTNTNIGNLNNTVNYVSHVLSKFTKDMRYGTNLASAVFLSRIYSLTTSCNKSDNPG